MRFSREIDCLSHCNAACCQYIYIQTASIQEARIDWGKDNKSFYMRRCLRLVKNLCKIHDQQRPRVCEGFIPGCEQCIAIRQRHFKFGLYGLPELVLERHFVTKPDLTSWRKVFRGTAMEYDLQRWACGKQLQGCNDGLAKY